MHNLIIKIIKNKLIKWVKKYQNFAIVEKVGKI